MSDYKIDGHIMSVNEFYTWAMGFVTLFRKGVLKHKKLPRGIVDIMHGQRDDKKAAMEILAYLKEHDDYMEKFLELVKEAATELAMEKSE